jgi:hypothetical protein
MENYSIVAKVAWTEARRRDSGQIVWWDGARRMRSHPSRLFQLALQEHRGARRSGCGTPAESTGLQKPEMGHPRRLIVFRIVKDTFEGLAEHGSDAESGFQCRRILSQLDGIDGLASDVDFVGQLLLGHLAMLEAQPSDFVANVAHVSCRADTARSGSRNAESRLPRERTETHSHRR